MKRLSGTQLTIVTALVGGLIMLASIAGGDVTSLGNIQLVESPTATTYTISPNGVVQYQEYAMSNPSRLVIDLVGVKDALPTDTFQPDGRLISAVRASQFQSEPDLVTRVVFEMTDGTHYKVSRKGTDIEVTFTGEPAVMGASVGAEIPVAPAEPEAMDDTTPATATPDVAAATPVKPEATVAKPESTAAKAAATKPEAAAAKPDATAAKPEATAAKPAASAPKPDVMAAKPAAAAAVTAPAWNQSSNDESVAADTQADSDSDAAWPEPSDEGVHASANDVVVAQNTPRAAAQMSTPVYGSTLANQAMTIDVQGADIKTVLRSISEFSGVNIIAAPDVEGPVVIHLKNVPWKEALDSILKSQGYGWRDDYGIIRVAPMEQLQQDEVQAITLDRKKEEMQSMVTRVVKLDFLNALEMKKAMEKVTTPRGKVEAEKGTNSVIVTDVPSRVDDIVKMIVNMDKRLSQVEIVAKMVDVDANVTRELGVQWQALNLQGSNVAGSIVSDGQKVLSPYSQVKVGTVQSWGDLNLVLQALEKEDKANIISNPRITTADNQEARIMVGKEIPLIVSDEAGNPITELKKIGVILQVTPHVNADGTITMDLHPELSDLASQATVQGGVIITLQEADTRVVVKDGETAVIGGLISNNESSLRTGVPVLKDMPLLGPLFRYESKTTNKRELIIFVTPKVVG
jgi:type IV pilus secretin PilQ/predicted competence protein